MQLMRIGLNLLHLFMSMKTASKKCYLKESHPKVQLKERKRACNKRKKIGGNVITEGEIHDYIMEREEERLSKTKKRRRQNEESDSVTIEHDGL